MNNLHSHNPEIEPIGLNIEPQILSNGINYFDEKNLKPYRIETNTGQVYVFVNSVSNQIEYAFNLGKNITHIPGFQLGTLKSQWNGKNRKNIFHNAILNKQENIVKFNTAISQFEESILNKKEKESQNPHFPNGTYIYTNQYGKEFTVTTQNGIATNITTDSGLIFPAQKSAITKAINENKEEKFSKFITKGINIVSVINKTQNLVKESIENNNTEKNHSLKYYEQFFCDELKKFMDYNPKYKPTPLQLISAQKVFIRFSKNTHLKVNELGELLNNPQTLGLVFQSIESNLKSELMYDKDYLILLIQLLGKIKDVFNGNNIPEKDINLLNEADKSIMINEILEIHKQKKAYH